MTLPNATLPYSLAVQFGGSQQPPIGPNEVTVTQQEFAHDIALIQIWAGDADADSFTSGMPMILTFGRPDVKRAFYGYVNHVRRVNNSFANMSTTDRNSIWVTCVGASWYMKQSGTQVFQSQTASQIVQTVATQFNLDASITPDSTVWPTIQMAGMSYWQLCTMLAQRIGYTFYCNGTQVYFKPRQTNPASITGLVASYDYRGDPAGLPVFTPTLGATSPSGGQLLNRVQGGVDPRTNQVIFSQVSGNPSPITLGPTVNQPIFTSIEQSTVGNQTEANAKTMGAGQLNQLYLTATATSVGNPLISQGALIYVANANGSQNGLWFTEKAVHHIDKTTYTTDLTVGRDSLGESATISGSLSVENPPNALLVNSKWVAA